MSQRPLTPSEKRIKLLERITKNYKLRWTCNECEEQKVWNKKYLTEEELNSLKWEEYKFGLCFEHRWENPIKLKEDWKEMKLTLSVLSFGFSLVIGLMLGSSIGCAIKGSYLGTLLWGLPLLLVFLWIWIIYRYVFKEEWQKLEERKSWWVKINKHE